MIFYPTVSMGELGKYANEIERVLLPASSWARNEVSKFGRVRNRIPVPRLPESVMDRAADCGGFVATRKWGDYRYDHRQYTDWLSAWSPTWAAMMDYCCEDEITSGLPGIVRQRQQRTTEMAHEIWCLYDEAPWAWVPTIQGWNIDDYLWHVEAMKPLISDMQACYGPDGAFRVGIGTLCARASAKMIREVVTRVAAALPGVPLHLWGVKLSTFQSPIHLPAQVASCDSAAWNGMFRTGRERWKQSGMAQREYCFKVALPAYEAKLQAALARPKQMTLVEDAS